MLVPNLRFNQFNNSYTSKKLSDIAKIVMGQSPDSKNYTFNTNATLLIQGNADLANGKIKPRIYTSSITKMCAVNDIIMTVRAPVGDLAISQYDACIGRGVCLIRGTKYLYYYLESFKQRGGWKKISKGSTIDSITSDDLKNININLPNNIEQSKISNFLTLLDKKIELQKRKIDALKIYKKGLLEKIYKEKLKMIKLVNLKEFAHLQGGFAFESELFTKKGIPIIRISNINENIIDLKDIVYYNAEILIDSKFEVNKGDMLIAMSGATTGKFGIYNDTKKAYLNQRVGKLILHKKDIIYSYLYFLFELNSYNIQLKNRLVAGAQPNISPSDIEALKFKIPSINVQKNIIDIYNSISKKIRENENKLKNLKDLKKGLLQKMFI